MKICEIKVFDADDYIGEFNLAKSERELVCKALIRSRGNIISAAISLRVVDKKVYSLIHQHSLQDFLERIRSGQINSAKNMMVAQSFTNNKN